MIVGTYASTRPYTCKQCLGRGCSLCRDGLKVRNLHLIGDSLNQQHIAVQQHLKDVEQIKDKEIVKLK